jgi:predicted O-methyltransferase YrrM
VITSIKKLIPVALKQPIRDYLDARAWRLQPQLAFDSEALRAVSAEGIRSAMTDPSIAVAFARDQERIVGLYETGEVPGGINPGDRRALYHLAAWLKPRNVLEIGTHVGASTVYLANALHHFSGQLTTVDIVDVNAPDAPWRSHGLKAPPASILSRLGLRATVTFLTRSASEALASRERYDLIFLDGDHSALAVYREISAALALLNPGGLILLHDFYPGLQPLTPEGSVIEGPATAAARIVRERAPLTFLPLGELPWPTKNGGNATSLALVVRRE